MKISLSILILIELVGCYLDDNIEPTDESGVLPADDHKEDKNHSETIQKILRDFEKTLDRMENEETQTTMKIAESNDTNIEEGVKELNVNVTTDEGPINSTENVENNTTKTRLVCNNTEYTLDIPSVHLLNGSFYQMSLAEEYNSSISNRTQAATCSLTLFFASWCDFSARAAPHYNALARVFPQIKMYAVDSSLHHNLNTQFGVMAVPTLLVFHNSRPLYKYNYTEYNLESFMQFVTLLTGMEPVNITEPSVEDFQGPVPSVAVKSYNYYLLLALIFTLLCGLREFFKSPLAGHLLDTFRNAWREAEIQHEHND